MRKPNFDKDMATIFDRCRRGGLPDFEPDYDPADDDDLGISVFDPATIEAHVEQKLILHHWSYRTPTSEPQKTLAFRAKLESSGELRHDQVGWALSVEQLEDNSLRWIDHLMGKSWATPEILFEFVTILRHCNLFSTAHLRIRDETKTI